MRQTPIERVDQAIGRRTAEEVGNLRAALSNDGLSN
jgi:hypothetical protein